MKFSVDVQTESCIFPCSSSVSYESFGAKAILWDIQVINVKSNLFNNFSTSELNSEQSMNDNENLVNISGYNDQIKGTKESLVAKLTSDDEPQKIKQEEEINLETNYHINQNAEQRMKTKGSDIIGNKDENDSITNIKIDNKTEDKEHKTKKGPNEEPAEINKDVENEEDAKKMIIKPNYEDTKCSFTTENNGHKTSDYKNEGSVNEENRKILKHNEYKNGKMCIGHEILGFSTLLPKSEDVNGSGKQTSEKSNVIIVNTNQSSLSKHNTEENSQNKIMNREAKRVNSYECKPNSLDDVFLDKTKSGEKKLETEYKKLTKDDKVMHQTSKAISSSQHDSTRSYSEVDNESTVNTTSVTMTNNGKHEQSTTWKENNRNPNKTNLTASINTIEGIRNSFYDEGKTSDAVIKRKKSSLAKNMSGGGRKISRDGGFIVFEENIDDTNAERFRLGAFDLERLIELGF